MEAREALERARPGTLGTEDAGRALLESRMGMHAALRTCPESAPAKRGMREVLRRSIERELVLRAPAAARALLAELDTSDAELGARIAALETELDEARRAREAEERRASEEDSSVGGRAGPVMVVASSLGAMLVRGWLALEELRGRSPGSGDVAITDVVALSGLLLAVFAARRTLLQNAASRRLTANFVVMIALVTATDLMAWTRGASAADAAPSVSLTFASCFFVASVFGPRELWASGAAALAALVLQLALPGYALSIQLIALVAMVLAGLQALRRDAERTRRVAAGNRAEAPIR
jgi:hypothetical protein